MRGLTGVLTAAAMLAAMGGVAVAEDTVPWDVPEVRGWSIAIDQTMGGGCFMYSIFEGMSSARLGFDLQQGNVYLLLADLDWSSIESDQTYEIELQMGGRQSWTASAVGGRMGDVPTLAVTSTDPAFLEEFASQNNIRVRYRNSEIMNLSLSGSMAALGEMLRCQDAVNSYLNSGDGGRGSDPFAN